MPLFHHQVAKNFHQQLASLFTPAGLYYLYFPDHASLQQSYQAYTQAFISANCAKHMGMITYPDASIVPYLTVRSNILINGQQRDFSLLPESLRRDTLFLDQSAAHLTAVQSLYVQLFRGLLAGRQFLLMTDFPEAMTLQETRLFLTHAQAAVTRTDASLIILTTDESLIAANPDTSWKTPPALKPRHPETA
ncbi:branched-chain amino acid ABC transporter ATP-binding protein [Lacticaseibacillus baoqingensis]|uniref:Branched-chain amino acid ABC transporter ATP-binding protein n=1 Tax=Lacticaseibacillus baoqingensis TaxID=2486013 RepID=A0ABW4E541_9LACO|nr:branched-chain amino acid ABC transporter ATP-binding protein [Lacticaseibacillus baoqingensis]